MSTNATLALVVVALVAGAAIVCVVGIKAAVEITRVRAGVSKGRP
ncbi:hypothetical protein [Streptomyces sp. NPDC059278]